MNSDGLCQQPASASAARSGTNGARPHYDFFSSGFMPAMQAGEPARAVGVHLAEDRAGRVRLQLAENCHGRAVVEGGELPAPRSPAPSWRRWRRGRRGRRSSVRCAWRSSRAPRPPPSRDRRCAAGSGRRVRPAASSARRCGPRRWRARRWRNIGWRRDRPASRRRRAFSAILGFGASAACRPGREAGETQQGRDGRDDGRVSHCADNRHPSASGSARIVGSAACAGLARYWTTRSACSAPAVLIA